jgi:PadR family transcriptional regulator PadR
MSTMSAGRVSILQGTLDLLILRSLLVGPRHGHGIAKHIQRTSDEILRVEHGSLYPALNRLEKSGCITAKWEQTEDGRELRLYRLTTKGRKQLDVEESRWRQIARAMARMLRPA